MPRERKRRTSDPAPYKKPPKVAMPTTRHSPARASATPAEPSTADVLLELALLRRSIEGKITVSDTRVESMREELLSKLDANDQAVSEVQLAITDVTLSVDQNQRAIHEVRAEVERREMELPQKVKSIVQEALVKSARTGAGAPGRRPRALPARDRSMSPEPEIVGRHVSGAVDRKAEEGA